MPPTPDHYQILGVPYNAGADDIKNAFRTRAVQYHPDKNPGSKEAEETFKNLSTAYRILSDADRRKKYDNRLMWSALGLDSIAFDEGEDIDDRKYGTSRRYPQKTKEEIDEEEIRSYEEEIRQTPEYIRFTLSAVIAAWGMQLIFTNWFINYADYRILLVLVGIALFTGGVVYFTKVLFRRMSVRNLKKPYPFNFEYLVPVLGVFLIAAGISLTILLCNLKKNYDLKYYAATTVGEVSASQTGREIWYEFIVDGAVIRKSHQLNPGERFLRGELVLVKYSMANPNIATVIGRR